MVNDYEVQTLLADPAQDCQCSNASASRMTSSMATIPRNMPTSTALVSARCSAPSASAGPEDSVAVTQFSASAHLGTHRSGRRCISQFLEVSTPRSD